MEHSHPALVFNYIDMDAEKGCIQIIEYAIKVFEGVT